jgi:hypothetical protein
MPGAAAGAGVSAISGLVSSLLGSNAATKASNTIGSADLQAAQIVNANSGAAQQGVGNATTSGQAAVNSAVAGGQAGVTGAVTNAQNTVGAATTNANGILSGVYNDLQSNLQPYLQAGTTGAQQLTAATAPGGSLSGNFSFDPTQIANNPDYQFQLQQGLQAVQRSQAASGQLTGGGTLKALTQYSQGLASNEIGQAYNQALTTYQTNRQNTLQNINSLLSTGQFGTSSLQQAAQNYGNQTSANTIGGAQYIGNAGLQGAQYNGNLGVQGAQYNGTLGLQGAQTAAGILNQQGV